MSSSDANQTDQDFVDSLLTEDISPTSTEPVAYAQPVPNGQLDYPKYGGSSPTHHYQLRHRNQPSVHHQPNSLVPVTTPAVHYTTRGSNCARKRQSTSNGGPRTAKSKMTVCRCFLFNSKQQNGNCLQRTGEKNGLCSNCNRIKEFTKQKSHIVVIGPQGPGKNFQKLSGFPCKVYNHSQHRIAVFETAAVAKKVLSKNDKFHILGDGEEILSFFYDRGNKRMSFLRAGIVEKEHCEFAESRCQNYKSKSCDYSFCKTHCNQFTSQMRQICSYHKYNRHRPDLESTSSSSNSVSDYSSASGCANSDSCGEDAEKTQDYTLSSSSSSSSSSLSSTSECSINGDSVDDFMDVFGKLREETESDKIQFGFDFKTINDVVMDDVDRPTESSMADSAEPPSGSPQTLLPESFHQLPHQLSSELPHQPNWSPHQPDWSPHDQQRQIHPPEQLNQHLVTLDRYGNSYSQRPPLEPITPQQQIPTNHSILFRLQSNTKSALEQCIKALNYVSLDPSHAVDSDVRIEIERRDDIKRMLEKLVTQYHNTLS